MIRKRVRPAVQEVPKPWYKRPWIVAVVTVLSALGSALVFLLKDGVATLENVEKMPEAVKRVSGEFWAWYHDDQAWNGVWSAKPEGYVDGGDMKLSETDLRLHLVAEGGVIGGEISAKSICKAEPLLRFLLLEGKVSGDTANILAFDFVGGKRVNFFKFLAKREGMVLTLKLTEGSPEWMPATYRIARHPEDGDTQVEQLFASACSEEREAFFKLLRGAPSGHKAKQPVNGLSARDSEN